MKKLTDEAIRDIIEWDILNWSQLIDHWQPVLRQLPADATILAFGERNGGLSLWLALNGFNVVCTDRVRPTDAALRLHQKYNVQDRITYEGFDVVNNTGECNKYDLIIAKSVLGGIKADYKDKNTRNEQTRVCAVQNILALLKPGGHVLFAENLRGNLLLHSVRKAMGKHKGWYYFRMVDLQALFKDFSNTEIKTFGLIPTNYKSKRLNKLSYAINKLVCELLTPSWNYISFIHAEKLKIGQKIQLFTHNMQ